MSVRSGRDAASIGKLLGRYVERRQRDGTALDAEELCRASPELLEPLREHIREYEQLRRLLAPPESLEPGRALLHYRILDRLGAGGMGQVFLAADTKLGRRVALKVLRPAMASDPERLARFRREARTVAALNHPNVVTLFSVEESEGVHFLTMELVEGKTLEALIPPEGVEPVTIPDVACQLVDALAAAHERGIIHRDLKPANVMVRPDGRLKVLDFGLAKLREPRDERADQARTLTVEGKAVGTLPYMSPEQVLGQAVDPRTDLFSLGVILYEMATGRRPFRGGSNAGLITSILRDTPVSLTEQRHDLPPALERIVLRCLEKEPQRRFPSALAVRGALDELRRDVGSAGRPVGGESRRIYISSTSEDLAPYAAAAREMVASLGFEPVTVDRPESAGGVAACARQVDGADAVVAIVGWRPGGVPGPELGGDGLRSYAEWEVSRAFSRAKPVLALMASERWPEELWAADSETRALMYDFRGELERLAVRFDYEPFQAGSPAPLPGFRALLGETLDRFRRGMAAASGPSRPADGELRLATWPPPELPERPYPLLLPYTHPGLLAGRERELAELRQLLDSPVPILGLYAVSGAGKSSLLAGGLVPLLRSEGRPVAYERHPDEAGLAGRLIGDLLVADDTGALETGGFVARLLAARGLAEAAPVLVLDQFEDLLRRSDRRHARAVAGTLLAASVQRQPGLDGPLCHWILAYRQEFHGEVSIWLGDVLREARGTELATVESLPHDLSGPERFHSWPLPPLGTPAPGSADRLAEAARAFQAAIETPLALQTEDGEPRYPWRFAGDGAAGGPGGCGVARLKRPGAPLAPELQVVLAHLLEEAEIRGATALVEIPEEPGELIDRAMEEHLRRALDAAFPAGRSTDAADTRRGRTRALLALRELADVHGRREDGLPADALAQAIGPEGRIPEGTDVLEKLATPFTRLVALEEQADGWRYVLSHDRMAEVLVRVVDGEGRYGELGVDAELVALRRFVVLDTELYRCGEIAQATRVPVAHFRLIQEHAEALLVGDVDRKRWWAACLKRRRADRRRAVTWRMVAVVTLALVSVGAWTWADRRTRRRALYEQVAAGKPGAALAALDQLAAGLPAGSEAGLEELRSRLRQRASPADVVEQGLGGVREEDRSAAVLRAVETALPLVEETPEDPVLIANLVWALDYAPGRDPAYASRARALRHEVLAPLRRLRPPPPPAAGDPLWVEVPGGTFWMGSEAGDIPDEVEDDLAHYLLVKESPKHRVTVSAFRMLRHEVTRREYRRLVPGHSWTYGGPEMPPAFLSWWEAYTYAAWLGGRLPTEAEWEYAARAGCPFRYCRRDGTPAAVTEVAWTDRSNVEFFQPVEQLEPNPWGLYDMYGNFSEWVADWYGGYSPAPQHDPWGPISGTRRGERGGAHWHPAYMARAAYRDSRPPCTLVAATRAIRVVLPSELP